MKGGGHTPILRGVFIWRCAERGGEVCVHVLEVSGAA